MANQIAQGNFTGMITTFSNQTIIVGMQPCVDLLHEIVGNDEFNNRAGTDDSTKAHMTQLIKACDRTRRVITYNPENVDIKSIMDPNEEQGESLIPINTDTIQMGSNQPVELPWMFDGSDPNLPLWEHLRFRNGIGGLLYGAASSLTVAYTRLESRNRNFMLTKNDSIRMWSLMQSFRDLCDRFLGVSNQVDVAQPLATDEPANSSPPNRLNSQSVTWGDSNQNSTPS